MWKRIKRWWDAEGAMMELQGVSDRMLADMGLDRDGLRDRVIGSPDRSKTTNTVVSSAALNVPCRC